MPKNLFAIAILFFATASCFAQEFEKNGLPCVAELCLGDGLAELSKVHWERAKNTFSDPKKPLYTSTRKLSDGEIKLVKSVFRGDVGSVAPFLKDNLFDSGALAALSRITAACSRHELIGTYTTQSGNPTRVGISLIPNQTDTTKHQWTVISITRSFPTAVSNEQKAEVESQLAERYAAFDIRKTRNAKPGEGRFDWNFGSFGFNLLLWRGIEEGNRMKLHPACSGTEKVRID